MEGVGLVVDEGGGEGGGRRGGPRSHDVQLPIRAASC